VSERPEPLSALVDVLVGKNQQILVSVSSANEAYAVISSVKKLRQSADPMDNNQVLLTLT